jgi:hypothetical protein
MDPVCFEEACKSFQCPSCTELHGAECDESRPSAVDICGNYLASSGESAFDGCTLRPLSVCQQDDDTFIDAAAGHCDAGTFVSIDTHYHGTGHEVSSQCTEHRRLNVSQMFFRCIVSATCTFPVIALLNVLFNRLRSPTERAIMGEWVPNSKTGLRKCNCCERAGKHVPPETLAAEAPHRLQRFGVVAAAIPYCLALTVGVGYTMLTAMVVITLDAETTTQWLLTIAFSLFSSWMFEPLKLVITTFVLSARCKRHKVKLRQAAALIHSTAILNARAVPRQNSAVPFSGGDDEVRAAARVATEEMTVVDLDDETLLPSRTPQAATAFCVADAMQV